MVYYMNKQEVWDKNTCEKLAKHVAKDGLGTPYPFKGYIGSSTSIPPKFGSIRYNGGCVRDGEWYIGEVFPLPVVADGFAIEKIPSWGYQIVKLS